MVIVVARASRRANSTQALHNIENKSMSSSISFSNSIRISRKPSISGSGSNTIAVSISISMSSSGSESKRACLIFAPPRVRMSLRGKWKRPSGIDAKLGIAL